MFARRVLVSILLFTVCALIFLFHPSSTYFSSATMDAYFGGEIQPGTWEWSGSWSKIDEPFKYRLLFRGLVDGFAEVLALFMPRSLETYWLALIACNVLSIVFSMFACQGFLNAAGFRQREEFILLVAWLLLPPVHNAFLLPVQTKEDFLAYGIFFLGLRAILLGHYRGVLVWTLLGAMTRETLMLIPLLFILGTMAPLRWKVGVFLAGTITHVLIRYWLGIGGYQVVRTENFDTALIAPYSVFMILGFGWVAILARLSPRRVGEYIRSMGTCLKSGGGGDLPEEEIELRRSRLFATLPFVLVALLTLHLGMGRIMEIRISVLLAPWVLIALGVYLLQAEKTRRIRPAVTGFGICFVAFLFSEAAGVAGDFRAVINPLIPAFSSKLWWLEFYLQISLCCGLVIALFFPRRHVQSVSLKR